MICAALRLGMLERTSQKKHKQRLKQQSSGSYEESEISHGQKRNLIEKSLLKKTRKDIDENYR